MNIEQAQTFIVPRRLFPSLEAATERGWRRGLEAIVFGDDVIQHDPPCSAVALDILTDWLACEEGVGFGVGTMGNEIGGGSVQLAPVMGREVLACFDQRGAQRFLKGVTVIGDSQWFEDISQAYVKGAECSGADVSAACDLLVNVARSEALVDGALAIVFGGHLPDS